MSDVTIPADAAKAAAVILRVAAMKDAALKGQDGTRYRAADLADLLDPPAPSLRDELIDAVIQHPGDATGAVDDFLAVVRRHVEALTWVSMGDGVAGVWVRGIDRDDVLRLLGGK